MIPFAVRLSNSATDQHITQKVDGLSLRSVVPGGYASATFNLQSPIDVKDPLLAAYTRCYVYDIRSGATVWEGKLQVAGRAVSDQGEVWSLTAIGPSSHTEDQTVPHVWIDRDLSRWTRDPLVASLAASNTGSGTDPTGAITSDVLLCGFPGGSTVNTGSRAQLVYTALVGSGQTLGIIGFTWKGGKADANYQAQASTGTYPTFLESTFGANLATAATFNSEIVITDFPAGRDFVSIRLIRTAGGALTVADDTTWALFSNTTILGRRTTADGSGFQTFTSSIHVQASWVIQDLLGRILTQYDGAGATLSAPDTYNIDQFAYPDGVTARQVLDDLMALEPNTYWAAWESTTVGFTAKHRFEWRTWPTTPRYEATVVDGFDNPAPTYDLYNKVVVQYRDTRGRIQRVTRTQVVPELDGQNVIRSAFIDLTDEAGTSGNATQAGDNFLAEHAKPVSGGTLTVARPIVDYVQAGAQPRLVQPWEIRPGELIRLRDLEPSSLVSASGFAVRDGQTVFRIVSTEVNEDGVATLELDRFGVSETRSLVALHRKRARRWRAL